MTNYKLYPNLPSAPPENPEVAYHLSIIRAKVQGLKNKEQMFKQKYEKYTKILNQLTWLNACSSGIRIATGISSVGSRTKTPWTKPPRHKLPNKNPQTKPPKTKPPGQNPQRKIFVLHF